MRVSMKACLCLLALQPAGDLTSRQLIKIVCLCVCVFVCKQSIVSSGQGQGSRFRMSVHIMKKMPERKVVHANSL